VGNCINMLSLLSNCNFPFLTIVTMRGEYGEFNSWQVPMSAATQKSLELMGLTVLRVDDEDEVGPTVDAALYSAYSSDQRIAILLSQKLIGRKNW
jgi:sulfopyruvate decarboxylase TPP-binding subunit